METVIKILLNKQTPKPNIAYMKFNDSDAGRNAIAKHANQFSQKIMLSNWTIFGKN